MCLSKRFGCCRAPTKTSGRRRSPAKTSGCHRCKSRDKWVEAEQGSLKSAHIVTTGESAGQDLVLTNWCTRCSLLYLVWVFIWNMLTVPYQHCSATWETGKILPHLLIVREKWKWLKSKIILPGSIWCALGELILWRKVSWPMTVFGGAHHLKCFFAYQPSLAGKQLTLILLLCDGFCQIRFCLGPLGGNAILTCTLANEDEGLCITVCNLSLDKPVAGSALDNWHRLRWEEAGHMWLQLDNWQ